MKFNFARVLPVSLISILAFGQVDIAGFHQALKVKKELYREEATYTGGDRTTSDFRIQAIRISPQKPNFDRVVLDFAGNQNGEAVAVARPPYYQVEINSAKQLLWVTVYGKPKLAFNTEQTKRSAGKTKSIATIDLLPVVDQDRWTFSVPLKSGIKAEVFELTEPARLIIDLKHPLPN